MQCVHVFVPIHYIFREIEEDEIVSEREISVQVCMSTPQILQYTYGGNIYTSIIVVVWQAGGNETLLLCCCFSKSFSPQNLYVNLSAFLHYNNGRVLNTNGKRGIRQTAYFNILFPPTKLYRHYQPTTITPPFMCIFQKKKTPLRYTL